MFKACACVCVYMWLQEIVGFCVRACWRIVVLNTTTCSLQASTDSHHRLL